MLQSLQKGELMPPEELKEKQIPPEILKQQDNQTCLICCLLMNYTALTGKKIDSAQLERELHNKSFGLSPNSFVLSNLGAFISRFKDIKATLWVDMPKYSEELEITNQEERIAVTHQEINTDWATERLETNQQPLLVYVDGLHFWRPVHTPHWIYVASRQPEPERRFSIIDTGFGRKFTIKEQQLENGISGLKYQMLWSPAAISLETIKSSQE